MSDHEAAAPGPPTPDVAAGDPPTTPLPPADLMVDEASDESFPASDPPSHSAATASDARRGEPAGTPDEETNGPTGR